MSSLNYSTLILLLASLVIAQYDPYAQRPYNQQGSDQRPYDRNNPTPSPYDRDRQPLDRYDRPGQGLSDRERQGGAYGQGQYDNNRDRYNQYDRNRTGTDPYDRNRDQYGSGYNRSNPYGQGAYDRDRPYGQGQGQAPYDRRYPQDGRGGAPIDDGNCCEDYCYDRDRDQHTKFGPVTAYQFVSGRHAIVSDTTQCKPILFWSLNKHGTNIPDHEILQRFKNLDRIRQDIIQNYESLGTYPVRGRLCQEDYELLRRWNLNESISFFHGKELSAEGKEELKLLARRYQNKYRDLLGVPYTESHYFFKYTNADRTYDSYQAYLEGLFNNQAFNVHAVVDIDDISRGFRSCYGGYGGSSSYGSSNSYDPNNPRSGSNGGGYSASGGYGSNTGSSGGYSGGSSGGYSGGSGYQSQSQSGYSGGSTYNSGQGYSGGSTYNSGQGYGGGSSSYSSSSYGGGSSLNSNAEHEYNLFRKSPEYMEVVRNVFRRMGFNRQDPNQDGLLEDIYNMCRYDKAWYPNRPSPWCSAFNKKQLDLLEYGQDLREYLSNGYGNEDVSNRLGCGILKEMYQRLERGVNGYTSDPKVAIRFGSAGSIENLLVAMGQAKDYTPLNAQNYFTQTRRKWRTAELSPFAANLVAVLHECDSTQRDMYKVMFYLNENPMDFAECNQGLCSWETVRSKFEDIVTRCDFCSGANSFTNSFLTIVLSSSLLIVFYKYFF